MGREAELEAARVALDGQGGLTAVVLTGEGGIGKSRLLAELVTGLDGRGWRVLAAEADPLERQIPYAPLARMIASITDDADAEVATLATELVATLDVLGGQPRVDVEGSFGRVCGQLTRLVRALMETRPLAVAIDDLHSLDDDTLAALAITFRRVALGHLTLLGSSRVRPPSSLPAHDGLLARLEADGALTTIELGPLDDEAISTLVDGALGDAGEGVREVVTARAEGNPFFALELAGSAARRDGTVLPADRTAAILQRFAPLDQEARTVMRALAVIGRAAIDDLQMLGEVAGLSVADASRGFDQLVAAGVLSVSSHAFTFTHDLVREAVYADIGPAEQRRLHKAVASELGARRAAGRSVDLLALARHVSEVAEPGDGEAAAILVEAGDRSRAIAPGSAAALYGRALELSDEAARGPVLSRQSRALSLAGQPAASVRTAEAALTLLDVHSPERARTITALISSHFELGRVDEALAVADAAVAAGEGGPVVVAQRPILLWFLGRQAEAHAEYRRIRDIQVDSDAERILVLAHLAMGAATYYEQRDLIDITRELVALGERGGPTLHLYAVAVAGYAMAMDCMPERALPLVEAAEAMLEDAGGTPFRGNILVARVMIDWLQGRWDEALDSAAVASTELEGAQLDVHIGAFHAIEIDIRARRGEPIPARALSFAPPTSNLADLKALSISGWKEALDDHPGARTAISEARARAEVVTAYLSPMLARLAELDLASGNPDGAKAALGELEEVAKRCVDPWTASCLSRARARVHGDVNEARKAIWAADAGGLVWERSLNQVALGQLDHREVEAVTTAYRTLQQLGADRERRRAGAVLASMGAKIPRQRATRTGLLTPAEVGIARLVQQGMRNKEIAAFLHYSPRTVEVYLSRIYAKLAVSSRLELARALDARAL